MFGWTCEDLLQQIPSKDYLSKEIDLSEQDLPEQFAKLSLIFPVTAPGSTAQIFFHSISLLF